MIDQGVTTALAARDANRNGDDCHTSRTGGRGTESVAREMEIVFHISNCSVENQIKFSTCTLLAGALTWWNSHVMTVSHDVSYAMTWADLRKKMTNKYCPRNEMKKLEAELWNLKVKGTDVIGYNQRFQKLALLCVRMFPEEFDKIERKVWHPLLKEHGLRNKKESLKHFPKQSNTNKQQNKTPERWQGFILQGGGALGQARNLLASSVEFKDTSRGMVKAEYNENRWNQVGYDRAPAKVYAVGHAGTNPDSNVVTVPKWISRHLP
ncbi:reverse transcriptase domain-containing protein [Tanacetum coccineum]